MTDLLILIVAGFGAGTLNTVAGGGTFLTLPALIFTGMPPVAANATSAVAVFPGYASGVVGYLPEMKQFDRALLVRLTLVTLAGALVGSLLLLVSSDAAFNILVPFLLLAATLVFLFGGQIRAWAASKTKAVTPYGSAGLFAVSVYGGYFNGGLGVVLLALFSLWGMSNLHKMNGLKNAMSFVLASISVVIFSVAGIVEWYQAVVMMVGSTAGGYIGAPLARGMSKEALRLLIAGVGFGMSLVFFARLFWL